MEGKEPESKYLTLWICVALVAVLIFAGWIFALKYNFNKINTQMEKDVNKTTDQAFSEVQDMFTGVGEVLSDTEAKLEKLEADKAAAEKAAADKAALEAGAKAAEPAKPDAAAGGAEKKK